MERLVLGTIQLGGMGNYGALLYNYYEHTVRYPLTATYYEEVFIQCCSGGTHAHVYLDRHLLSYWKVYSKEGYVIYIVL